jgi:hypothetical protein
VVQFHIQFHAKAQSENQSAPAISGFQRFAVFGLFFAPLREILESLTDPLLSFSDYAAMKM